MAADFIELLRRVERGEMAPPPQLLEIMQGERLIHNSDIAEHELYPGWPSASESPGKRALFPLASRDAKIQQYQ